METLYWSAKDVATTTLADSQGLRRDSDQVTELNKGWFVPPTNFNPGNKYIMSNRVRIIQNLTIRSIQLVMLKLTQMKLNSLKKVIDKSTTSKLFEFVRSVYCLSYTACAIIKGFMLFKLSWRDCDIQLSCCYCATLIQLDQD